MSGVTLFRRWISNTCGSWPLFTTVKTTVPVGTFVTESANRYSVIFTVTCETFTARAGVPAGASTRPTLSAAQSAALRKCEGIEDVSMSGLALLVAVTTAAALQDSDVLLPVHRVRDARSAETDLEPALEVPQVLAGRGVVRAVRRVRRVVVADEDEAAGSRERRVVAVADRRHPHRPGNLVGRHVHRLQVPASARTLVGRARDAEPGDAAEAELRAEVRLPSLPGRELRLRVRLERGVAVVAADVLKMRLRVVARRLPVGAALRPRCICDESLRVVRREDAADLVRLPVRSLQQLPSLPARIVLLVRALRGEGVADRLRLRRRRELRLLLRHLLLRDPEQRQPIAAVEDVQPARLSRCGDSVPRHPADRNVEQHRRARQVVVPDVVMDGLVPPAQRPGVHVERDERVGEEVATRTAVRPRIGVADAEVDEPGARIDARGRPDRSAAVPPLVARPRAAADLTVRQTRVEAPQLRAVARVVRGHRSARAHLAAGDADDHLAVAIERRHGHRAAFLPPRVPRPPHDRPRLLVERHEPPRDLGDIHLAV